MTGVQITITTDDAELKKALAAQIVRHNNPRPFYASVGEHMLNSVQERFDTQTAPDGSAWTPLAPSTVASRLKRNGNAEVTILRERGRLAGSINYRANRAQVEIGTPMVQAAIQHFGGETGRNHAVTIPARPFLGLSPNDETAIGEIAEDFLRF